MLLTYKIHLMQHSQQACAVFLHDSVANQPNGGPPFMPASICCILPYKLLQKNENDHSALFISVLAHLFPVNLNSNCYYAIKIIEVIR
jgi:hypothetical protein